MGGAHPGCRRGLLRNHRGASSAYAGTVYKIDTSGRYSVLHLFTTTDGRSPGNSLVQGTDLNFYGTTSSGGLNGLGTFFRISSTGNFAVLHDFNSAEGARPGPLIQASDGNFYGAISGDGATNYGCRRKIDAHRNRNRSLQLRRRPRMELSQAEA